MYKPLWYEYRVFISLELNVKISINANTFFYWWKMCFWVKDNSINCIFFFIQNYYDKTFLLPNNQNSLLCHLKENLVIHLVDEYSIRVSKASLVLLYSEWIVGIGCKSQFSLFRFPVKMNFSSKHLIQRTEFFVGNLSLWFANFSHFSRRSDFSRRKENGSTFSLLVRFPLGQPNATHLLTIFVKQNITKAFKKSILKWN